MIDTNTDKHEVMLKIDEIPHNDHIQGMLDLRTYDKNELGHIGKGEKWLVITIRT